MKQWMGLGFVLLSGGALAGDTLDPLTDAPSGDDELVPTLEQFEALDRPFFEGRPIVNGTESDLGDYPNVVLIGAESGGYWAPFCSGTIIAEKWVVTAAHCSDPLDPGGDMYGMNPYVYLGADIINGEVTQRISVTRRVSHPNWDGNVESGADIALFEVWSPAQAEPAVLNDEPMSTVWHGTDLRYVGFGVTFDDGNDSAVQRTVTVPYYDHSPSYVFGYAADRNFCSGDSGGATFEPTGNGLELAGVISFTQGGCEGGRGASTRIDKYLDWIQDYTPVTTGWPDGDADTDADSDSDTDTDVDTDTDTDTDTDDAIKTGNCTVAPAPWAAAFPLVFALFPLLRRRRS